MKHISLRERARCATVGRPTLRQSLSHFKRDEDGGLIIFSLFIFVLMVMAGGMAVDFMRFEAHRARLQGTLDRAVLAAADLDQVLSPQAVVEDYFQKAGMSNYLADVNIDQGLNYRTVNATGEINVNTFFLRMMGIDTITAPGSSTAEERVTNVEISLVVDISGSMRSNNKMRNLRDAAEEFVDTVIREETEDLISLSIIPYTAQVNVGPDIMDMLPVDHVHDFSHCIDFEESDFNATTIRTSGIQYDQMQHFESGYGSGRVNNPGCPVEDYERVIAHSQDADDLKDNISQLRDRANTSIHIGMKWGVAVLDPSFRPVVNGLIAQNDVDIEFAGRPVDYSDSETLKTVVLMTDGVNVDTYRIADWAYDTPSKRAHWDRYELFYYLNNRVYSGWRYDYYYKKYANWEADNMLSSICTAAKAQGILVWSIGFEVTNASATIMQNCASSPSHFFRVEGVEISDAFASIARQINQLRLTQ